MLQRSNPIVGGVQLLLLRRNVEHLVIKIVTTGEPFDYDWAEDVVKQARESHHEVPKIECREKVRTAEPKDRRKMAGKRNGDEGNVRNFEKRELAKRPQKEPVDFS